MRGFKVVKKLTPLSKRNEADNIELREYIEKQGVTIGETAAHVKSYSTRKTAGVGISRQALFARLNVELTVEEKCDIKKAAREAAKEKENVLQDWDKKIASPSYQN